MNAAPNVAKLDCTKAEGATAKENAYHYWWATEGRADLRGKYRKGQHYKGVGRSGSGNSGKAKTKVSRPQPPTAQRVMVVSPSGKRRMVVEVSA